MAIKLNISPRIIPSIATSYNDVNRIFMEYIDNSIDSAEDYYDSQLNAYNKDINIILTIKSNEISIEDNCGGIRNFEDVVGKIGDSGKKYQPWTNGQFGYGIYSFMAACEYLELTSKLLDQDKAQRLLIDKNKFDTADQDAVYFEDFELCDFIHSSGTKAVLSNFDKSTLKQINIDEIKGEIERHFELLLSRHGLKIIINDETTKRNLECKTFDYNQFEGEEYKQSLSEVNFMKGGRNPTKISKNLTTPINIYLKITKNTVIDKPPVFILKGRRIAEIKDIKQFNSSHKSDIWGHPNLTGYIDLHDFVEPTIARNDFKNNDNSKALFSTLKELEPLILDVIKDVNDVSETQHYQNLEELLNKALSKLARLDSMNFRAEPSLGDDINLSHGSDGVNQESIEGDQHFRQGPDLGAYKGSHGNGTDGNGLEQDQGPSNSDNPFEDSEFKGSEKKKSGFNIKIVERDPPTAINGKLKRSQLIGGEIIIFRKHPDFDNRVSNFRDGQPKITQRLITYLAGEITVHYKDKLQSRQGQAEYNIEMFENLVEFIYKFEEAIGVYAGKNLSDLIES